MPSATADECPGLDKPKAESSGTVGGPRAPRGRSNWGVTPTGRSLTGVPPTGRHEKRPRDEFNANSPRSPATSSCAAWLETRGCPRVPSTKPSTPPTAYLLPSSWPSRQEARNRRQRRRCSVPLGHRRSSCSTMNFSSNVSKTLRSTARPSSCVDHTARSPPSRSSGSQNRPRKALSLRYGSAGTARWPPPDGVCTVGVRFIFCRAPPARTPSLSGQRYTLGASQARPSPAAWESGRRHTGLSRNSSFAPPPRTKTWAGMLPEPPIRTFAPSSHGEDGRSPAGDRQGRRSSVGRPPFRLRTVDASRRCVGP